VLAAANIDSTTHPLTDEIKADIFIKCAECFLAIDESVDAETFVTRASAVINNVPAATAVNLRYRTIFARVLDANRKFLDAAMRYFELSTTSVVQVRELSYAYIVYCICIISYNLC
jgi:COP9 signalosome complex subunit 4